MTRVSYPPVDSERACKSTVRFRRGRDDWCVRDGWHERLFDPTLPDWFTLEDDPRAECVKIGRARKTWRVTFGNRTVFAKVFDEGRFLDHLKRRIVGGAAKREWRASRDAEARGVPVVRPLAFGVHRGHPSRWVFLSEGLDGAVNLPDVWERIVGGVSPPERRVAAAGLIDAVARFFSTAHERGFVHGDGHANNILVRGATTGEFGPAFVDVHSARVTRRPASVRRSVGSLVQLDQYFHRRATRGERLRFLRSYLARRPSMVQCTGQPSHERRLLTRLARAAASNAARLARTRDRRLLRNGKYFSTLRLEGGWRATVILRLERRHVFPERDVPDRRESDWRAILEPLVATWGVGRAAGDAFDYDGLRVEPKRLGGLLKRLSATLRGPPHWRAFERCHKLRHRDIPSGLILAYVEHRRSGLVDATMLIRPTRAGGRPTDAMGNTGGYADGQD
ncbi:MAG: lipopolysaccharide kinase InaA family protein [Phycisphaerae bacterium]